VRRTYVGGTEIELPAQAAPERPSRVSPRSAPPRSPADLERERHRAS